MSRPLRYVSEFADLPGAADVISLEAEFGESSDAWTHRLAETLDLCVYLSGSVTARRVEASFDRRNRLWPVFGVFSIRFDNGSLAVCSLRQSAEPVAGTRCITSRNADVRERVATLSDVAVRAETDDFLSRLAAGSPPRVSIADGLKGARLVDHLMSLLR